MTPHTNPGGCGQPFNPAELGAAGVPYSTQADYRPIPPDAMGTLFGANALKKRYVTEEIGDGIRSVTQGAYDAMFVQTGNGVTIVDMPPMLGERMRRVIAATRSLDTANSAIQES